MRKRLLLVLVFLLLGVTNAVTLWKSSLIKTEIRHLIKTLTVDGTKIKPLPLPEKPWFVGTHPILIRHAGGGVKGGYVYTNSKEAIEQSIAENAQVIEVDVCLTSDGVPVLAHDFTPDGQSVIPDHNQFLSSRIAEKFTPVDLAWILTVHKKSDFMLFIDGKPGAIIPLAKYIRTHFASCAFDRIIFQVASLDDLHAIVVMQCFPYVHYNSDLIGLMRDLPTLKEYGVRTASVWYPNIRGAKTLQQLKDSGIVVFAHTINHSELAQTLIDYGCRGIFTDFLKESDVSR